MSRNPNKLHLNAFLMSVGHHEASWRLPESDPYAGWSVRHFQNLARIAERGKLDSLFLADSPVQQGDPGQRPTGKLEPTVLLTALAGVTEHIGLIATASTSYNEPYNLARRFASLDHVSGGRSARTSAWMTPASSRITRSASAIASSTSWVTSSTAGLWAAQSLRSRACILMRVSASSAPNGSSASSKAGRRTSERASATRCCSPPESS